MGDPVATFETRLIKGLLTLSVVIHMGIFLWSSWRANTGAVSFQEASIEADLEMEATAASVHAQSRAEEILVDQKILPQLPPKFEIKEKVPEVAEPEPDPEALALQEEKKKAEEKKPEVDTETVKRESLLVLQKKQALERLLKEKARNEKKFDKETKSPLNEVLLARKKQLTQGAPGIGDESFAQYGKMLKKWMQNYYSMPEIYALQKVTGQTVIELMLDGHGNIKSITTVTSSGNASFDQLALSTVQRAAPFPAPPPELVGKKIHYHFDAQGR
jgi:protein TonB